MLAMAAPQPLSCSNAKAEGANGGNIWMSRTPVIVAGVAPKSATPAQA
jgi:hypothetical protein